MKPNFADTLIWQTVKNTQVIYMTLCFFIATMTDSGGTQRVTSVIANDLVKKGYGVSIITWYGGANSFFYLDSNIKVYALFNAEKINLYKNYVATLKKYTKVIDVIKPDIVIDVCVPLSLITMPVLFFRRKIKKIAWEHFNAGVNWNRFTGPISRRIVSFFYDKLVVLTNADKQVYEGRFNAKNVVVLPNPVTISNERRSDLSSKVILAIGRLTFQKGFDLLLNAWAMVCGEHPDWKLKIVGGGEDFEQLATLIKSLTLQNNTELIAPTNEIEVYYCNASIFVMSSRFEGLPLVLIEAKSFGLPLISFNCKTGPAEIITNNIDGILVEPDNIRELATAISLLISSPELRRRFSDNGNVSVKKFSVISIVNQWETLIKEITIK